MNEGIPVAAVLMWLAVMVMALIAWRRHDGTVKAGGVAGLDYFKMLAPRMVLAMLLAGFATELLPRETISGWLGADSGFQGILIASAAGALVPAGGVVAFPLALAMYNIGVGIPQLVAFLTTWEIFAIHRILAWEIPFLGNNFVILRVSSSFFLPPLAGVLAALIVSLL